MHRVEPNLTETLGHISWDTFLGALLWKLNLRIMKLSTSRNHKYLIMNNGRGRIKPQKCIGANPPGCTNVRLK